MPDMVLHVNSLSSGQSKKEDYRGPWLTSQLTCEIQANENSYLKGGNQHSWDWHLSWSSSFNTHKHICVCVYWHGPLTQHTQENTHTQF